MVVTWWIVGFFPSVVDHRLLTKQLLSIGCQLNDCCPQSVNEVVIVHISCQQNGCSPWLAS